MSRAMDNLEPLYERIALKHPRRDQPKARVGRPIASHCINGHERTAENLRGHNCLTCIGIRREERHAATIAAKVTKAAEFLKSQGYACLDTRERVKR